MIRNAVGTQSGRGERGTEPCGRDDAGSVAHRSVALGPHAQRRYFPTPEGIPMMAPISVTVLSGRGATMCLGG